MPNVQVSFSPPQMQYLEDRVAKGVAGDVSQFVTELVQKEIDRQARRAEISQSLVEAMAGGLHTFDQSGLGRRSRRRTATGRGTVAVVSPPIVKTNRAQRDLLGALSREGG